jgi:predicted CopG family antitoxin
MRKKKYTNYIGVLFDDETYNNLVRITDEAELSLSEFVRTVIETKLKNENEEELNNERT